MKYLVTGISKWDQNEDNRIEMGKLGSVRGSFGKLRALDRPWTPRLRLMTRQSHRITAATLDGRRPISMTQPVAPDQDIDKGILHIGRSMIGSGANLWAWFLQPDPTNTIAYERCQQTTTLL